MSVKIRLECPICASKISISQFITLDCNHKACIQCLKSWFQAKFELGQIDLNSFSCFSCKKVIDPLILETILGPKKFKKICNIAAEKFLIECPNKKCKEKFVNQFLRFQ